MMMKNKIELHIKKEYPSLPFETAAFFLDPILPIFLHLFLLKFVQ
jgi:hypothetical protein